MIQINKALLKRLSLATCFFLLAIPYAANALDEREEKTLRGTALTTGAFPKTLTTQDAVFAGTGWSNQVSYGVKNIVKFEIDFFNTSERYFYSSTFTAKCNVTINCYTDPLNPNTITKSYPGIDLDINFNPAQGATYKGIATYKFDGSYKVDVIVNSVTANGINIADYPIFQLTNELIVTRQYNFNAILGTGAGITNYSTDGSKLQVSWVPSDYPGAEAFDLEWTYIDELSAEGAYIIAQRNAGNHTLTPAILAGYFRNNSSRITLPGSVHNFNLNYNKGFVLFRIRGIQHRITDGLRLESEWSYKAQAMPSSVYNWFNQGIVDVDWHSENLNWQYNAVFAEDGARKEVISYYDGSLRSRQSVTLNNADNTAVVAEPVYDAMGRAAMTILPAPIASDKLKYYPLFNVNTSGKPVSYLDIPYASCGIIASPLSPSSGVEQYYSSSNPFMNDPQKPWNDAIPKSEGFPFSVTQFTADNTGRVRAQGGVGKELQLGKGHESKYFYGKPSQYELDRLFGAEAGDHTHYLKNMVVDGNGQVSVSYVNSSGQTVATALAGNPPTDKVDALASATVPTSTIHDVILTPNSFHKSNKKLEASSIFLVPSNGNYKFTWRFTPEKYVENYSGGQLCYTCSYDLLVKITDDCGTEKVSKVTKKINPFDISCNNPAELSGEMNVLLEKVGEYSVYFELVVNEETLDEYTKDYLIRNIDLKKLPQFLLEQLNEENLADCYNDCESCSALPETVDEFLNILRTYYEKEEVAFGQQEIDFGTELYNTIKSKCEEILTHCNSKPCQEVYDVMLADVMPGGQYAEYDENYELVDPEINVLANYAQQSYYDEDGNPAMAEDENGNMVPANELSLKQFIQKFEASWATSLVPFHPEYCYYTWCTMNEESQTFNVELENLNDAVHAMDPADRFFDRNDPLVLLNRDPFFTSGNGVGYYPEMKNDLERYSSVVMHIPATDKDILKTIDYLLYCGNANPAIDWDNCNKDINDPCRSDYKEWLLYKQWYLECKLKYYQLAMQQVMPECKNCFIPSSGGADPADWTGCVAPGKENFTVEAVANSTADGLKRIIIKYRGGNETVSWPINVSVEMYNTSSQIYQDMPVVFAPGFGSQEVTVPEGFDVFTIKGATCAELISEDGTGSSGGRFATPGKPVKLQNGIDNKLLSTSDPASLTQAVAAPQENPCDFPCPTTGDFEVSGVQTNTLKVCYTGADLCNNHSATAYVKIVYICGGGPETYQTYQFDFCSGQPRCKEILIGSNCTILGIIEDVIPVCDVANCAEWNCPKDSTSFSMTVTKVGDTWQYKVCYTGAPIPQGKVVKATAVAELGCTTELWEVSFCANSGNCSTKTFTNEEACGFIQGFAVKDPYCIDDKCDWECPTDVSNYEIKITEIPEKLWKIDVCYKGPPIPPGKVVIVDFVIETLCGKTYPFQLRFCSLQPLCQTYIHPQDPACEIPNNAFVSVAKVSCEDKECEWICPTEKTNYTVTSRKIPNTTKVEIKLCYWGPPVPQGRFVIVNVKGRWEKCEEFNTSFTLCPGSGSCMTRIMDMRDCGEISNLEIGEVECGYGDCPWECPSDGSLFDVTSSRLPDGSWQATTCYLGPPIPAGKRVIANVVIQTGCGTKQFPVSFCSEWSSCQTRLFSDADVCGKMMEGKVENAECNDSGCEWQCPEDKSNYIITKKRNLLFNRDEIKVCYTGPPIPFGKTVVVKIAVSGCERLDAYEIRFCQGNTCNTRILKPGCAQDFTATIDAVNCVDEPCGSVCPDAASFTAIVNGTGCNAPGSQQSVNITVAHPAGPLNLTLPTERVKVAVEITTRKVLTGKKVVSVKYVTFYNGEMSKDICFGYPLGYTVSSVKILSVECKGACPSGDCCDDPRYDLYAGKVRRFQDYVEPAIPDSFEDYMNGGGVNFSAYPLTSCKSECEAMADGWMLDLKNCTTDPVTLERIRRQLIDVCKQSCELQRGNVPIIPYSDANPAPSFESVIRDAFGGSVPVCSEDLISDPYPWGKSPIPEKTFATETNEKICRRLEELRNEAAANGFGTSSADLHAYLTKFYQPYYDLDEEELKDLYSGCDKCDGIIRLPVELPLFMDGNAKACKSCDEFDQLKHEFENKYPGILTTHDKYEVLFRNFMNHKTGFSYAYANYADFMEKCEKNENDYRTLNKLCETPLQLEVEVDLARQCMEEKFYNAYSNAVTLYTEYIDSVKRAFRNHYTTRCLESKAFLESDAKLYEYHYTLYYYDQSNNLVKTIPPEGVEFLEHSKILALQANRLLDHVPPHRLGTTYEYNSFNNLIRQTSPDGGTTQFWYDILGRLVVSQNSEQKNPVNGGSANRYSYTKYDPILGRVTEVGEKIGAPDISTVNLTDKIELGKWLNNFISGTDIQIIETIYDKKDVTRVTNTSITSEQADYLSRKRVVANIFKKERYIAPDKYDAATHYTYDIMGNATTVWTESQRLKEADPGSQGVKRIDYSFDLISGKVKTVYYQKGKGDQFIYRYNYDIEKRMVSALSSRDALVWQNDARYNYYLHGSVARTELGSLRVQGIDYTYTLQGWLKYINGPVLNEVADIGRDGDKSFINGLNAFTSRDAMSYGISYFNREYKPIKPGSSLDFDELIPVTMGTGNDIFNGNIRATTLQLSQLGLPVTYSYRYDQLNRLVKMRKHSTNYSLPSGGTPASMNYASPTDEYGEETGYDANGNIKTYLRNGVSTNRDMDDLTYQYEKNANGDIVSNKLRYVHDQVSDAAYPIEDINNQTSLTQIQVKAERSLSQVSDNYQYDAIGNIIKDKKEDIDNIEWTVSGKIKKIIKSDAVQTIIEYEYDAIGNRIYKKITTQGVNPQVIHTFYVRDATGNVLAIYSKTNVGAVNWMEQHLYGQERLGIISLNVSVPGAPPVPPVGGIFEDGFDYGKVAYELSNHLGNVYATISDKKQAQPCTTGNCPVFPNGVVSIDYYYADVITSQDYYPFGMMMPGRKYINGNGYRYGFNGKENDNEAKGEGNQQDYGARVYDTRLGRFLSVDPLFRMFCWQSPYVAFDNNPINIVDPTGMSGEPPKKYKTANNGQILLPSGVEPELFESDKVKSASNPKKDYNVTKGSVRAFNVDGKRYTASFNSETGEFLGYYNGNTNYLSTLKPQTKSREDWGARAPNAKIPSTAVNPATFYNYIVVHHAGNENSPSMKDVQDEHMDDRGFNDIGYHFGIDLQGNIYEGRPLTKRGAGAGPVDEKVGAIHIVILGDLQSAGIWEWSNDKLTDKAVQSLITLSQYLVSSYNIQFLGGHQNVFCNHTSCPGNQMMDKIKEVQKQTCTTGPSCVVTEK